MSHSLSPMYRLLLLGAGDVAKYVAEMARALEYDVTLCDPRPNYLDNWEVEGVEKTSACRMTSFVSVSVTPIAESLHLLMIRGWMIWR